MKRIIKYVLISSTAIFLSFSSAESIESAKEAVNVCLYVLLPSLFPFFVISKMFILSGCANSLGKIMNPIMKPFFNINGNGAAAFVMGIISGYPVGAKTALELYQNDLVNKREAENLLCFCNNSGPLFIIGSVGSGMLGSSEIGLRLYAAHVLSAVSVGVILRFTLRKTNPEIEFIVKNIKTNDGNMFTKSVEDSMQTIMNVFGYVIFFAVIMALLQKYKVLGAISFALSYLNFPCDMIESFLCGILEVTMGTKRLSSLESISPNIKIIAISCIIGWASLSVHAQVKSVLGKSDLSFKKYIFGKMTQAVLSCVFMAFILWKFPVDSSVSVTFGQKITEYKNTFSVFFALSALIILCYIKSKIDIKITYLKSKSRY